jgi:hypothetical protein
MENFEVEKRETLSRDEAATGLPQTELDVELRW